MSSRTNKKYKLELKYNFLKSEAASKFGHRIINPKPAKLHLFNNVYSNILRNYEFNQFKGITEKLTLLDDLLNNSKLHGITDYKTVYYFILHCIQRPNTTLSNFKVLDWRRLIITIIDELDFKDYNQNLISIYLINKELNHWQYREICNITKLEDLYTDDELKGLPIKERYNKYIGTLNLKLYKLICAATQQLNIQPNLNIVKYIVNSHGLLCFSLPNDEANEMLFSLLKSYRYLLVINLSCTVEEYLKAIMTALRATRPVDWECMIYKNEPPIEVIVQLIYNRNKDSVERLRSDTSILIANEKIIINCIDSARRLKAFLSSTPPLMRRLYYSLMLNSFIMTTCRIQTDKNILNYIIMYSSLICTAILITDSTYLAPNNRKMIKKAYKLKKELICHNPYLVDELDLQL